MTSERIQVATSVLRWARESAGLSIDAAVKKLGVSSEVLMKWEAAETSPTLKQLRKAASTYKRPLAVLLLPEPPKDYDALRDFRQFSTESPELRAETRRAATQRDVFLELQELSPSVLPGEASLPRFKLTMDPEEAGGHLRSFLGASSFGKAASPHEHLNAWIAAVESQGVIVMHTRGVAIKDARGFSLSEWPYPVIALNGSDFPRPRLFTLLHECTHLALNAGGICDLHEATKNQSPVDRIEHYCNAVAAAALMPAEALLHLPAVRSAAATTPWTTSELGNLAQPFGVSTEAFLLRLVSLNRATWETYWALKKELDEAYEQARAHQKQRQRETEGGPSYYVVKARDLGHGYASSVLDAFSSRVITSADVTHYLDVRFDQLPKLQAALR